MAEQEIRIDAPAGMMTTFISHPDGKGSHPVAILYMDAPGYREQLKVHARRFSAEGYYVVVPDLFYHFGEGVSIDMAKLSEEGFEGPTGQELMRMIGQLTPDLVQADSEALLEAIEGDDAANSGPKVCVGYCMGARFVLHMLSAKPREFVAGAGIHPGGLYTGGAESPHHELADVEGELYFGFGDQDQSAPVEAVDAFRAAMAEHGVRGTCEIVPGCFHGYSMADIPVYDKQASERHFEIVLDLWRRNLAKGPVAV